MSTPLRITAVGDISFEGRLANDVRPNLLASLRDGFTASDLVIGNLECALLRGGSAIPGKCTLRGDPAWAQVLHSSGIRLVTLANNHIMDFGPDGLMQTIHTLEAAGIKYVGAGRNRAEAYSPLSMTIAGRRVAFLARSSVIVSAPTEATDTSAGVALFDANELKDAIVAARKTADLVVLILHWGIEEYLYPSPAQRETAKQLAAAGADAIIGHHPHVLQGVEYFGDMPVIYSVGNFVFDEFEWHCISAEGHLLAQFSGLTYDNRSGLIATIEWNGNGRPTVRSAFTRIRTDGIPEPDVDPRRQRQFELLSSRLGYPGYAPMWRLYSMSREWQLRVGERVSLAKLVKNLHRIRPRHITGLLQSLRRSARIVSEKTSNPYE
jgi:Bacterial capsule synthesis protein PGA_cap